MAAQPKPVVPRIDYTPTTTVNKEIYGADIDYLEFDQGLYPRIKSSILRAIKPINPFAIDHDSTEEHVGIQPV